MEGKFSALKRKYLDPRRNGQQHLFGPDQEAFLQQLQQRQLQLRSRQHRDLSTAATTTATSTATTDTNNTTTPLNDGWIRVPSEEIPWHIQDLLGIKLLIQDRLSQGGAQDGGDNDDHDADNHEDDKDDAQSSRLLKGGGGANADPLVRALLDWIQADEHERLLRGVERAEIMLVLLLLCLSLEDRDGGGAGAGGGASGGGAGGGGAGGGGAGDGDDRSYAGVRGSVAAAVGWFTAAAESSPAPPRMPEGLLRSSPLTMLSLAVEDRRLLAGCLWARLELAADVKGRCFGEWSLWWS